MSEDQEREVAEYVLGTLPAGERVRFEERLATDRDLQAAVRGWQQRLAPLDASAAAEAPPAHVWNAIERAMGETKPREPVAAPSNVIRLERRVAAWRGGAIAAGALAAGLAAIVVLDLLSTPPAPTGGRYVAVVDSGGREPALIAEVDTNTGIIRVRALAAATPAGHSLELWHVSEGHEPRSLGILDASGDAQTIQDMASSGPLAGIIAVSVEPAGGSPTGKPTGDVIYTGELVPME